MATENSSTAQEITALEKKFWKAMREHDVDAAVGLTDFPCIVAGPGGVMRVEEKAFRKMMTDSKARIDDVDLDDFQVRFVGDDVAVCAYKVHETLSIDGEDVTIEAADTSTWVRRDGHWACAAHSESLLGDSYGRDRTN